jgi:hypothetical protein
MLALAAAPAFADQTLFNFVRPTDVVQVTRQDTVLPELTAEPTAEGEVLRRLTFNPAERPSLRLTPQQGHWDWSGAEAMSLRIQNAMDWALTLDVRIESRDGQSLSGRIALPAGPAQTLLVPLRAVSPLALGMRAGPAMPWTHDGQRLLLATQMEGGLNSREVVAVTFSLERPEVAHSVLIGRFGVREGDDLLEAAYTRIVDAYGQSSRRDWPGKVERDEQLQTTARQEQEQLQKWLAERPEQDRFGGWLRGPTLEKTGFFHTAKHEGRWYLVSPEGHPFFSLGVNSVSARQSQTYVEGREWMFAGLPAAEEPLAAHYGQGDDRYGIGANRGRGFAHGRWFDFYGANLQRTYGEPPCVEVPEEMGTDQAVPCVPSTLDAPRWRQHTLDRLAAWGFNTLGSWSSPGLAEEKRLAYTVDLVIQGDFATINSGFDWWGGMPDPFDPRFAMAAERAIAIATRDRRHDPWLVGYFAGNEQAWAGTGSDPKSRYGLAYATLRLTTDVPAKRAFLKHLRDRYRNHQRLSAAWGIDLQAWELMEDPGFEAPLPNPAFPAIEEDLQRFQRLFADTYFKTIADSLEWHAPNHLLLGGRFAVSTPEAVAACAQYCDVLSFNFYTREPQQGYDFKALRKLDKPVLIGEFHFGSRDRGPFWGGLTEVAREEERGPAYAHFLERALSEPSIVGAHWFQYLDQPVTGRLLDGENGHFGLVGITDRPYQDFVDAVRKANLSAPERWFPPAPPAPETPAR